MIRTQRRDEEFEAFFSAEAENLRRLAVFLTGDPVRGADVAQEALVRVYQHWGRIRNEDPGPYARRTLVNLIRSAHRRSLLERRHAEREQRDLKVVREADTARMNDWLELAQALKKLSPTRRAVIVLRFYEDMSEAEIARVLDRPLGTVKSDVHRGLAQLRPLLEQGAKEHA